MAKFIANRYEIVKTIGHGGMADVYLALDRFLNREVAIKVLKADSSKDPVALQRFSREAIASTKLSHPNIVDIYDVGDDGDQHYIVMEYVKGYTLKQLIQRRGAIPPREAVWMCKQLAGALMEAHKNGLIHRDIKSQNVLIKDDGTIKLADFGIAILNNAIQLTSKDSVLGSVHYLAPELAKGGSATMQSDIYSLGIVFYELLTGDVPYKGDTPVQIALMHIKNNIPDPRRFNPQIPQSVVNVLMRSTARDPKERYDNIALMIKDLNTCLDESRINEQPVKLNSSNNVGKNFNDYIISSVANRDKPTTVEKKVSTLLIVTISLISIIALACILLLTGILSGNHSKFVDVPDITGLRLVSAIDALDAANIEVDYPVEHILTDDVQEGLVVDVYPKVGSQIEIGKKVKVTVSSGIYSIMDDYIGKNIDDVKTKLSNTDILIKITAVDNDEKESGTILSQTGIEPGDKYDPNTSQILYFDVAYPTSVNIPTQLLGKKVEEVVELLEEEGFKVKIETIDFEDLNESDQNRYHENEVCKIDPEEGSLFVKSDDSYITLYYYE